MFCSSCGREIRPGALFCDGCGASTTADPVEGGGAPFPAEADVVCFVGDQSGYYLGKFRSFQVGRVETFVPTWNWNAFLFTTWWFLYRKMYLWALLAFVASCIPVVGLVAWIAVGVAGNYLYYRHASAQIGRVRAVTPEGDLPRVLAQVGGVNRWVIWVGVVLTILAIAGIIAAISIPLFMKTISEGTRAI
jgi:hypothetical protein